METLLIIFFTVIGGAALVVLLIRENRWLEINHFEVPAGEYEGFKPLKIIHISDIHVSPWALPSSFSPLIERINSLEPDYVLITGDFVTHFKELIPGCSRILKELKPSVKTFAVLGNHDYWVDSEYLKESLKEAGINLLLNSSMKLDGDFLPIIAGLDDPYTGRSDISKTLKNVKPGEFTILMAHSPDIFKQAAEMGVDLVLAGHTHGGQIRLPIAGALYIPSDHGGNYDQGWFKEGKSVMYVNRGLGSVFPPMRFFCRKEITVLRLTEGSGDPRLVKREFVRP